MDLPPPRAPKNLKLTAEERRVRDADRLATIRLRVLISRTLEEQGITDPYATALAFCMPAREAIKLLNRHRWREGDMERLQAVAARLGMQVPD